MKNLLPIVLWLFVNFFALFLVNQPLLEKELFRVHDYTHGARIAELARGLLAGQFPVRWSDNFGFGYGMPLFKFYAPLPYYLGAISYLLGFNIAQSIKIVYWLVNVLTMLASFCLTYFFLKWQNKQNSNVLREKSKLTRNQYFLISTLVNLTILLAPYRAVNLYVRGALSEVYAIAFMILILAFLFEFLIKNIDRLYVNPLLVFSMVGLFLSHNISSLIFTPIFLVTSLLLIFFTKKSGNSKLKQFFVLVTNCILAIGIAAFYLIPAFFEKELTKVSTTVINDYFNYKLHFLYLRQFIQPTWKYGGSVWGPDDGISFFWGYQQILVTLIFIITPILVASILMKYKRLFLQSYLLSFTDIILTISLSIYMTLLKSEWLWNKITILAYVQFPWRWLAIIIIWLGILVAWLVDFYYKINQKLVVFVSFILISLSFFNVKYFKPELFLEDSNSLYYDDPRKIAEKMSFTLFDYLPKEFDMRLAQTPNVDGFQLNEGTYNELIILINQSAKKLFRLRTSQLTELKVPIACFAGWIGEINGKKVDLDCDDLGLIKIVIPAGVNQVGFLFEGSKLDQISDWLSFLSLALFLALTNSQWIYKVQKQ